MSQFGRVLSAMVTPFDVAMVCAPPPTGYARWTIRVTTEEAKRRGIVADVGRETVRQVLAHHELKPWREKNVVRPEAGR